MKKEEIIKKLKKEAQVLNNKIYELEEEEIENIIFPKLKNMVGWCMKLGYRDTTYQKILEWGEHKEFGIFFILERIGINNQGEVSLLITSDYPYINKEWWNVEIPLYAARKITPELYEKKKLELLNEMTTRNKLRKFNLRRI